MFRSCALVLSQSLWLTASSNTDVHSACKHFEGLLFTVHLSFWPKNAQLCAETHSDPRFVFSITCDSATPTPPFLFLTMKKTRCHSRQQTNRPLSPRLLSTKTFLSLETKKTKNKKTIKQKQLRNPKPGIQADYLWCDTTTELLTMVSVNLFRPSGG